jgi:hypothetical protein
MKHLSLEHKIKFLNGEKEKGTNYTFKHHINYLGNYYEDWFKDFYKEDEVLILKRRDVWKWFLSFLFQDFVGWKLAHFDENTVVDVQKYWVQYDYSKTLRQFFDIKSQLERCEGRIIYYEDLKHEAIKNKKLSDHINYEDYFPNIDIIKRDFKNYD